MLALRVDSPRYQIQGIMVGTTGLEPATSASRTQRSTRLSYVPTSGYQTRVECIAIASGKASFLWAIHANAFVRDRRLGT